jgi:transcription elongation factor GreB
MSSSPNDEDDGDAEAVPRSNYITAEGAQTLRAELQHLWSHERPRVTQAVSEAAAMGDRSENAEYIYGKKRLREIDRRIRYLTKRLEVLTIVTDLPPQQDRVFFGAWVRLVDEHGTESNYRIVGPDEFDLTAHCISVDAPLARALLRKTIGDEVELRTPKGILNYEIMGIWYVTP